MKDLEFKGAAGKHNLSTCLDRFEHIFHLVRYDDFEVGMNSNQARNKPDFLLPWVFYHLQMDSEYEVSSSTWSYDYIQCRALANWAYYLDPLWLEKEDEHIRNTNPLGRIYGGETDKC